VLDLLDVAPEEVVASLHRNGELFLMVVKEQSVWHDDKRNLVSEGC
jgi:hypothetical protein